MSVQRRFARASRREPDEDSGGDDLDVPELIPRRWRVGV